MAQAIEFTLNGANTTGTILKNKGIAWQVELMDGSTCFVQKKHVTRGPWEEEETVAADPCSFLGTALSNPISLDKDPTPAAKAKRQAKAEPTDDDGDDDGDQVTLKQLCFELKVEPRIARRRLRKAQGLVGTGSRWEWAADSDTLAEVKALLSAE